MDLNLQTARKSIDNAFLRETIEQVNFDRFRREAAHLLTQVDQAVESGEDSFPKARIFETFLPNALNRSNSI